MSQPYIVLVASVGVSGTCRSLTTIFWSGQPVQAGGGGASGEGTKASAGGAAAGCGPVGASAAGPSAAPLAAASGRATPASGSTPAPGALSPQAETRVKEARRTTRFMGDRIPGKSCHV